jgi:23S rRNA (uracil1939-C5)-methyltransferase
MTARPHRRQAGASTKERPRSTGRARRGPAGHAKKAGGPPRATRRRSRAPSAGRLEARRPRTRGGGAPEHYDPGSESLPTRGAAADGAAHRALDCPHFPPCAGCPKIPVPYAEQLDDKRNRFIEELRPLLAADVAPETFVNETVPSPRLAGYRNQARLVFRQMSRGGHSHIGLGLYVPGTHRVIHIPNCPIQPDRLNAVAASVVHFAESMQLTVYDERTGMGCLRYLALRCDRGRKHVLVTIIVADDVGKPLRTLAERVRARHPEVVGVGLHVNARHSNVLFAGDDAWMLGADRLEDTVGSFQLFVSQRSFLQVNHAPAEWIYAKLAEQLAGTGVGSGDGTSDIVLDLYCGVGGIALHLAREGRLVVGVEAASDAVEDARRAAHRNGVANVRFVTADVAAFLREPASSGVDLAAKPVSAVVLNPPRAGCGAEVMRAVAALGPAQIAYVSCRPFSLVRDLRELDGRYAVNAAWPIDMIPLTPHIESLTLLSRRDR